MTSPAEPSAPFASFGDLEAHLSVLSAPDAGARAAAEARDAVLTKPAGALGRLEEIALWAASWRGTPTPLVGRAQAIVFAGTHGVAARGVSAYPPEVTQQMVLNFEAGGAAINQLCALQGAELTVIPLDLERPTADFTAAPAMSESEALGALNAGWAAVDPSAGRSDSGARWGSATPPPLRRWRRRSLAAGRRSGSAPARASRAPRWRPSERRCALASPGTRTR